MALDARAFPGVASEAKLKSSASTPSLRSRESEIVPMRANTPDIGGGGNVEVVVRVRGFLPREIERGAECLVEMNPATEETKLLIPNANDPANSRSQARKVIEEKSFTFDHSFWSHNPADEHYAPQEQIYDDLGEKFLNHNFEGYHTCIFAYGQTGSGKSYTMMGTPGQRGLIPRTCEDLFQRIENNDDPQISSTVRVSYFEVYNEHVRDLLRPVRASSTHPYYNKIREHPTEGPIVVDLTEIPVKNYAELLRHMHTGDASRTTASTKMNDTSSRSHAVFTIVLKQIHHDLATDSTTERLARIRLVDLAGSERAKSTEATGTRLREGSNINKSLTTLGRVIAALADPPHSRRHNGGKTRSKDVVPYRDSILTWLLKDSLGGNSRTAMIACIAPSDYDETLSTLRYADQAKHIRTRAIVNQDSVSTAEKDAQIAEYQNEIRKLQVELANKAANDSQKSKSGNSGASASVNNLGSHRDEQMEEYQSKVDRMQRLMEEERLVGESKVKQLVEQNIALRLHLKLAVESLKNPIALPDLVASGSRSVSATSRTSSVGKEQHVDLGGSDKETHGSNMEGTWRPYPAGVSGDGQERMAEARGHGDREMQAHAEDLLRDLGMFRRKVADDHMRFGVGGARGTMGVTTR